MNNIIINNNILNNYQDEYIKIDNNTITFLKDKEYNITYINSSNIKLNIIINNNVNISLFILSKDNNITINNTYTLEENSKLSIYKFYQNKETKEHININLNGIKSIINYNFSSITKNNEKYKITINHNNNYTKSIISNKCIGCNNSNIDFTIDSILPKGNIDCIMDQTTKILTLENCDAKINPNMYIEEDSVEAKHGSVISSFNEDEIFYLTSRGISKEESINLLIKGFIFSNLKLNMENKAKVYECINNLRR